MSRVSDPIALPAEEVLDGVPVLADEPQPLLPARQRPAAQAVVVAAGSFVAGVATLAMVQRRRRRGGELGEVLGSNSFLIDVHLLRRN